MIDTCLMEFNKDNRRFEMLKEIKLITAPSYNDKIIVTIDGIGIVFKVYDVHYTDNGNIDVNVVRLSTITEYNSSGFRDI